MIRMIVLGTVMYLTALAPTTKAVPRCAACLPRSLTLIPSNGAPGSVTPIIKMLPNTPQGCLQMNVKCITPEGYPRTVMRFNGVGPPKVGKDVVALVSCFQTSWRTTYGGSWMMLPNTPQGCLQMNVKCITPEGYPRTVMRFNGVGPPKVGKDVVALVSCFQTSWRTTYGGSWIWAYTVQCTLN